MTKLYAYAIAGLLAVIGLGGLVWWGQEGHQKAQEALEKAEAVQGQLDASNEALRLYKKAEALNEKVSKDRAQTSDKLAVVKQQRTKALHDALQVSPDWASTTIPDGVWNSIGPGQAAPADQAPTSSGAGAGLPSSPPAAK